MLTARLRFSPARMQAKGLSISYIDFALEVDSEWHGLKFQRFEVLQSRASSWAVVAYYVTMKVARFSEEYLVGF